MASRLREIRTPKSKLVVGAVGPSTINIHSNRDKQIASGLVIKRRSDNPIPYAHSNWRYSQGGDSDSR